MTQDSIPPTVISVSPVPNAINVARATMQGLRSLRRPDDVAALRGKSAEEVSTTGMLGAYRERQRGKLEVTEVA